jgi:hypothetical protein
MVIHLEPSTFRLYRQEKDANYFDELDQHILGARLE